MALLICLNFVQKLYLLLLQPKIWRVFLSATIIKTKFTGIKEASSIEYLNLNRLSNFILNFICFFYHIKFGECYGFYYRQ